jgi:hypothetical protein
MKICFGVHKPHGNMQEVATDREQVEQPLQLTTPDNGTMTTQNNHNSIGRKGIQYGLKKAIDKPPDSMVT